MKMIPDILKNKICSFYFKDNSYYDGFLLASNGKDTILHIVDDNGSYQGILLVHTDAILYIESETKHCLELQSLCKPCSASDAVFASGENLVLSLLERAKKEQWFTSIGLGTDFVSDQYGTVANINGNQVYLNLLTNEGIHDGKGEVNLESVFYILCEPKNQVVAEDCSVIDTQSLMLDSLNNGTMVGIYSDPEEREAFTAGFVLAIKNNTILLLRVSPDGDYDGYSLFFEDEIFQAEDETQYLNQLTSLFHQKTQPGHSFETTDNLRLDLITFAYWNKKIISAEVSNSGCIDIYGMVKFIDTDWIVIQKIKDNALNGLAYVEIDKITDLFCDTQEDRAIRLT